MTKALSDATKIMFKTLTIIQIKQSQEDCNCKF
uniref:Uncharacterized protein n=1 Tax=Rhizophora mucronata TaxID=61149 RepID=A0A2P2Q747_RHIMU